jgi:4-amino-4-deoxy-L-arabinose transferase-like glycosyltransferase
MSRSFVSRLYLAFLWAMLTFISLKVRPLFPIDETRYAAVAWEMWVRNDFLVPHLNGETYSHKPPLLFWLMQLNWWAFGVNDWSLRIIAPLFSLASLYLSATVAKVLWPERKQIAELTPFILLGCFFWMIYGTLTMFDIMLSFFALLGIYALSIMTCFGLTFKRCLLLGFAIGGGVLTKGPVILLHILPLALLAPWWLASKQGNISRKQWYSTLLLSVLIGAGIALSWAIPAGLAGGEAYRKAIFLGQTSGRIVDSFAHKLPWWWYLELLPLLLLPWILIKPFWIGLAKFKKDDFGCRFCMVWALPVLIAFSLVSGKRVHYLLPLMPAIALLMAWALDQANLINWRRSHIGLIIIYVVLGLVLMFLPWLNSLYSWKDELSSLSPLWGVALLLSALYLGVINPGAARLLAQNICTSAIAVALSLAGGFFQIQGYRYDTAPPAQKIAGLMDENRAVAFFGSKYHGQFHFAGRLTQPIHVISSREGLIDFARNHLTGYILVEYKDSPETPVAIISYHYPFKNHEVGFISCQSLIDHPQLVSKLYSA